MGAAELAQQLRERPAEAPPPSRAKALADSVKAQKRGAPVTVETPLGQMTMPVRGTDEQERQSLAQRSVRQGAADLLATPGIVGALPALAAAGVERATGMTETFGEGLYDDEGRALLKAASDPNRGPAERLAAGSKLAAGGNAYLRPGMEMASDLYDWATNFTGAPLNPDGTEPMDQVIGGTLLTSAIALPLLPVKALSLGSKAGTSAARMALRAAEYATPLTVVKKGASAGHIAAQGAINATVGVGIDQGMRALLGEETLWNRDPAAVDGAGLPGYEVAQTGALVSGIAGLSVAAAALTRPGRAASIIRKAAGTPSPTPAGSAPGVGPLQATNVVQAGEDVFGDVFDDKAVIKHAVERVGNTTGRDVDNAVRTLTGASLTERVRRAYELGDLGKGVRIPPVAAWKRAFSTLSPQEQAMFDMAVEAHGELRLRQSGIPPSLTQFSNADLQTRWERGVNHPTVGQAIKQYREITEGVAKLQLAEGRIGPKRYKELVNSGALVPDVEARSVRLNDIVKRPKQAAGALFRGRMLPVEGPQRVGGMTQKMRPSEMLDHHVTAHLRDIAHNNAQKLVLRTLEGRKQIGGDGNVIVRRQSKKQPMGGYELKVWDGDQQITYVIGDKRLHTALMFRPRMSVPGATELRRWLQWGTTGNGNPAYALMSAINDLGSNLLGMRTKHMVSGRLDQGLRAAFEGAGMPVHVSNWMRSLLAGPVRLVETPFNFVEGMWQNLHGRWREEAARHAKMLAAKSGEPLDEVRAQAAIDMYYKTRYALMQESGYAPNAFVVDYETAQHSITHAMDTASNGLVRRSYKHLLESMREAFRMAAFSRNYAAAYKKLGRPLTETELQTVTGHVRALGGDITKQSRSQGLNALVSTIPFGNTILQSTAHLVQHALTNPAAWSVLATLAGMKALANWTLSDEAKHYVETQVPDYTRVDTLFIEHEREEGEEFDPTVHLEQVPLSQELGTALTLTEMLFGSMLTAAGILPERDIPLGASPTWDRAVGALAELVSFSTPPIINLGLTAAGLGPVDLNALGQERALTRTPRIDQSHKDIRGYDLDDGVMSDRIANMLNAAFGTAGRLIADGTEHLFDHKVQVPGQKKLVNDALSPKAWRDAMDVTLFDAFESQQVGQWLTDAAKALPRSTPVAKQAYEMDRALEDAARLARELTPNAEDINDADLYSGKSFQLLAESLSKPELAKQAIVLHAYLLSDYHQADMEAVAQLKVMQHRVRGSTDAPVHEKNRALNTLNSETQDRLQRVLFNSEKLREGMVRISGNPDWTIDWFMKQAQDDLDTH